MRPAHAVRGRTVTSRAGTEAGTPHWTEPDAGIPAHARGGTVATAGATLGRGHPDSRIQHGPWSPSPCGAGAQSFEKDVEQPFRGGVPLSRVRQRRRRGGYHQQHVAH